WGEGPTQKDTMSQHIEGGPTMMTGTQKGIIIIAGLIL
ncbi:uncharacterized protein METZ01_LOCUS216505, partial [marine metagenome]